MIPFNYEINCWLVSTLQHVCHVEYFLDKLSIGKDDHQRPHDIVGFGNKYEWEVIKGFALQYRNPKPDFDKYILPSLLIHRKQYHHQKFNKKNINASKDNIILGAVDAICSRLENRIYQGGKISYTTLEKMLKENNKYTDNWMLKMIPLMKSLKQPSFEKITSLTNFFNIGIKKEIYEQIIFLTNKTIKMLKKKHGYSLTYIYPH